MRRFFLALPLAVLAVAWLNSDAGAQEMKKSRGTIVKMAADSITLTVAATELTFAVDDKTKVEAPGGGTKAREAAAAGKPGPKLSEVLKVGDAVEVSYHDAGGRHAASIRKVSSPGSGGIPARNAAGTVTDVSASSLSISGSSGGGASFTQTFVIDAKTKIIGRGVGTALAKTGGKAPANDVIAKGDHVSVSFEEAGGALHASEVRITAKGK
jgi:hypothetical protein